MRLSSPFFHHALSTNKVMLLVIAGLIPGAVAQIYFFGYGVLINLIICAFFAIATEFVILKLRNRDAINTIKDNSALLTGLLLGLAIPPTLPLWMSIVGVAFAIIFAKQLYGGLGFNPFNPAMVGYVLLLISFPVEMTAWMPSKELTGELPSFVDSLLLIINGKTAAGLTVTEVRTLVDGFTMATPLDHLKTERMLGHMTSEIASSVHYQQNLIGWQLVNLGFFIGGLFLLAFKVIRWQIPLSILSSMIITSWVFHAWDPELYASTDFHLSAGATMLGAFFIATDPVSAATTPKGRIIYGALIGLFVILIRNFGGYPEAFAFAVLLLNLAAPTIDHYTQPIIYGHKGLKESEENSHE